MVKTHGFAGVNGTNIYYEVFGTGIPIVFVHGFSLDSRCWEEQFDFFAKYFQVIRYDMRGFGKSALPTRAAYSHSDDLRALLDFLSIDRAMIVGLSRGGKWVIQFALDYPDRVAALVVVDAMPHGYEGTGERPSVSRYVINTARSAGVGAAKEVWLAHPIFAQAAQNPTLRNRLIQIISDYSGWHWFHEDPAQFREPAAVTRLREITLPTLIIVGENDTEDFKKAADFIHQQLPNSQKFEMHGVGHLSNMEDPQKFNETVLTFLLCFVIPSLPR